MARVNVSSAFAEILEEWFELLAEAGISITPTSGLRSIQRQREIYRRLGGRGLAAKPGRSFHEYGLALDFVAVPRTRALMLRAGELAESLGLRWGGRFRVRDEVHVDAGNFLTIAQARREGFPGDELTEVS